MPFSSDKPPILLTGASGQLGGYLLRRLAEETRPVTAWSGARDGELFGFRLQPVDFADTDGLVTAFHAARPSLVIHVGAASRTDACYRDQDMAWQTNVQSTELLTDLAAQAGARLLLTSTDLVFDGDRGWYREDDPPSPISVYGETKAAAERAVAEYERGVVVRLSLLFGPTITGRPAFFDKQLASLRKRSPCALFEDEWRTPLSVLTAARGLLAVAASDYQGILHFGGPERLSRLEMGQRLARFLGKDASVFAPAKRSDFSSTEPRPRDASLDSTRWRGLFPQQLWPTWEEAMDELIGCEGGRRKT